MRILAFPYQGIAYNDAFYAAVKAAGGEVMAGVWAGRWLLQNLRKDDVVHIHWPSFLYASEGKYPAVLRSFFRFLLLLAVIRLKTREIWWTAHNLLPHERCAIPVLDILSRKVIVEVASRIFVHGVEAEKVLVGRFPRAKAKCVRIPHGNWIDHYRHDRTRESARTALGLPKGAFIYLFFGQCKRYKNLDGLIKVFLPEASSNDLLLVAGKFSDESYLSEIVALANGDSRIRIDARFIPDDEVSSYFSASDAMCVPYREILTSGATMLALSFGKPVISINRGFLRDVMSRETGILIEPNDGRELANALRAIRERPWSGEAIIRHARRFSFTDAAKIFLNEAKTGNRNVL
jgi:beta-1,4-mannosyltransferase